MKRYGPVGFLTIAFLGFSCGSGSEGPTDGAPPVDDDGILGEREPQPDDPPLPGIGPATESQCGPTIDWVPVESGGSVGPFSSRFVSAHMNQTGNIHWNTGLLDGNVSGLRWCTGTLISEDLFLTASHCFESEGWIFPSDARTDQDICRQWHVDFEYQRENGDGRVRRFGSHLGNSFRCTEVVERELGGLDYAIIKLAGAPGNQYGTIAISQSNPEEGDNIIVFQHPEGMPKVVDAGTLSRVRTSRLFYSDLDTAGGSSGSGILDLNGTLIGVHTNGGCESTGNSGVPTRQILSVSPTFDALVGGNIETDTQSPTIEITHPTTSPSWATEQTQVTLGGSAEDNVDVVEVEWSNLRSGSGPCSGSERWSCEVPLFSGSQIITIVARDPSGNEGTDRINITRRNCAPDSGSCCDSDGDFRRVNWVCDDSLGEEFQCSGPRCGGRVEQRALLRFCTGWSARCEGEVSWGEWNTEQQCGSEQICREENSSARCVNDPDCVSCDEHACMDYSRCREYMTCDPCPSRPAETCNNQDDDCDGQIDEGLTRSCSNSCGSGTETCSRGSWGSCSAPQPRTEVCDNQDNDCDGRVDEELTRPCSTACGSGTETCSRGSWVNCSAPQPQTEVCDGADNDCDGQTDEGCNCINGQTQQCGPSTDRGECEYGSQTCTNGQWGSCQGAVYSSNETCDNRDNDCDGSTDEGLTRPCSNSCGSGTETCSRGSWGSCSAPQPQSEVCDGNDNDCDGSTDEGNLCPSGQTCSNGRCVSTCTPSPEVCDGRDNDCDGSTDENLSRPCSTACGSGTETCSNGNWINCSAPTPRSETCNNQDDDCDGQIDESLTRPCSTACGSGTETCSRGSWINCTAPQPQTEICDGADNDCDGQVDEGVTHTCTDYSTCTIYQTCDFCPEPPVEVCNSSDDNCNGQVDEFCECTPDGALTPGACDDVLELPDGSTVVVVRVPGGSFVMGNGPAGSSQARHIVTIHSYRIWKYEVTVEEYDRCVRAGVCSAPVDDINWGVPGRENYPIQSVTYPQARDYCWWGDATMLPTEAMWEKAARGTDERAYPWGNTSPTCELAVYDTCRLSEGAPVGSRPNGASPFGVMDMSGNAWEWIWDWYDPDYYETGPTENPDGPNVPNCAPIDWVSECRVVRGGCARCSSGWLGASVRHWFEPSAKVGFRCVDIRRF